MVPGTFTVGRLPRILFGEGMIARVPEIAASFGNRALIVTGRRSFRESGHWTELREGLGVRGLTWETASIEGEPSPREVDETAATLRGSGIQVVIGIGGGSALDAAKAIAGLLRQETSVMDFLEGVGRGLSYEGPAVPFIAVPTTAGTGSEATKNAVLSDRRAGGFKKSFRHECLVASYAVVDPSLLASCPREVIAADGMDAITQLIESYTSARANPMTDALAISGLEAAIGGLWEWYRGGGDAAAGRRRMGYAALVSGITLAQVGLGAVHGLASPLGAFFPIPHGVVCGTLVGAATEVNIAAMEAREPDSPALAKYARLGALFAGAESADTARLRNALIEILHDMTARLDLPRLGVYGVRESDIREIVADSRGSSMKSNPIVLTDDEIASILRARL